MSALALAASLLLAPAAAPDSAAVSTTSAPDDDIGTRKAKDRKAKRTRRKKSERESLAEVLALEPPAASAAPIRDTTAEKKVPTAPPLPAAVRATSGVTTPATTPNATPSFIVPSAGVGLATLFWPGLLLVLGAVALLVLKRRQLHGGMLNVVETVAVGRGRDLVVVDVGGSRMLLGCTDGGIAVLEKSLTQRSAQRTTPSASQGWVGRRGAVVCISPVSRTVLWTA